MPSGILRCPLGAVLGNLGQPSPSPPPGNGDGVDPSLKEKKGAWKRAPYAQRAGDFRWAVPSPAPRPFSPIPPFVLLAPCQVELPHHTGSKCACNKDCESKFTEDVIFNLRSSIEKMSEKDRSDALFQKVALQVMCSDGETVKKKVSWTIQETVVCKPFWCYANYCGHANVGQIKQLIKNGHMTTPPKLPKVPTPRSGEKKHMVDAWFMQKYRDLAEPMAVENPTTCLLNPDEECNVLLDSESHPLWGLGVVIGPKRGVPIRYLNPGKLENLWQTYCNEQSDNLQVGK